MPCSPNDNSINIPPSSGIPIPGLGDLISPIQIPLPDIDLPTDLIEDFVDLLQKLGALFPSGLFKPNPDFGMSSVLDFIADLLGQLAPFLSFYNFIMAALNMIICIIEVLCAIPNPFAVAVKLKRLFTECLPPFLNLFPWLALIAMILALLLLILALIIYLIETIIKIIEELLKNLLLFGDAQALQDGTAALAIAQKIAALLCLIENLLAILLAIAAILAVIQALAAFAGSSICSDEDTEGCCSPEICPPFIKSNYEIEVEEGTMVYHKQIGADLAAAGLPASLLALLAPILTLREERWQVYSDELSPEYPINLIITPSIAVFFGSQIFYPENTYTAETPPKQAPYTVDMTVEVNPAVFGHPDIDGSRLFQINDCIVFRKPLPYFLDYQNSHIINTFTSNGVFSLQGGLVFEEDGTTPYQVSGEQATLNTFITESPTIGTDLPVFDDGYYFDNVSFVWKPNHPALASQNLITVGCIPEVGVETTVINAFIAAEGPDAVLDKLDDAPDGQLVPSIGILPNVVGAQECVQNALNEYRANITLATTAQFQATMETCLNDLADQTTAVYCGAFIAAVSLFQSTFSVDTDVQFTTREIIITAILRDAGGTNIASNIPDDCLDNILDKLSTEVTLGTATDFEYDSDNAQFTSILTSTVSGAGELRVLFENNVLSTLNSSEEYDVPSTITEDVINYTFVDAAAEPEVRRDETDTARS